MRRVILAGIILAPVAAIAWIIARDHVPDLEPEQAARIISSTPEFNHSRSVVKVLSTRQASSDSIPEHYCLAKFILTDHRARVTLKANAEFRYWSNKWHLREFSYEQRPDIKPFVIKSDPDPQEESLK